MLRNAISNAGTMVMLNGIVGNNTHRPLDIYEFRAFALVDDIAPLIFINNRDSNNGKLFSLLHEFAHICRGENSLFNEPISFNKYQVSKEEILCNAVAAEILVPTDEFERLWSTTEERTYPERISNIARHFCCSEMVIARKALDNGYIDSDEYNEIADTVNEAFQKTLQSKKSRGGNYYRTASSRMDHNFLICLAGSVASGGTSYTDAFAMTNTNRKTYENLMRPST